MNESLTQRCYCASASLKPVVAGTSEQNDEERENNPQARVTRAGRYRDSANARAKELFLLSRYFRTAELH